MLHAHLLSGFFCISIATNPGGLHPTYFWSIGKWHIDLLFYLESQPGFLLKGKEVVRWVLKQSALGY